MKRPAGAGSDRGNRVDFDSRVRLEFKGAQISSDGGLLLMRQLDDALGLSAIAGSELRGNRPGRNKVRPPEGMFRQAVFSRLAGCEDVNDAGHPAHDPAMRQVVGGRAAASRAASAWQMGRFETGMPATPENIKALPGLCGQWIDRFHDRAGRPEDIALDMDSSESPAHGDQEGAAWNGHFGRKCHHPIFVSNQHGMPERCALRNGNEHSAHGWQDVLGPVIARCKKRGIENRCFRADAAYAQPELYEFLEEAGCLYAIRLKSNPLLQEKIKHRLNRPAGSPPTTGIKQFRVDFQYQAKNWNKPRRVIAKIEWRPGELLPRAGFIVTSLPWKPEQVARFHNQRGTAEQHIKEGKRAIHWTRPSRQRLRDNEARLQLHASACDLAAFLRCIDLPEAMAKWSVTSLRSKLIKTGARRPPRP